MIRYCSRVSTAVIMLVFCLVDLSMGVVYVDADRSGGNGTSWAQAYKTIEDALYWSGENQEFWIAEGTYAPSLVLWPKHGAKLYGGFAGTETSLAQRNINAHPVIVDGQNTLEHVFFINEHAHEVRIDGLTIKRGNARYITGSGWEQYGGGMFVDRIDVEIMNCTFTNNSASIDGGGLFINRCDALVEGCDFVGNTASDGGGLGGHTSDTVIRNCSFRNNTVNTGGKNGGAVWFYLSEPSIEDSSFSGNTSGGEGGAIQLNVSTSTVSRCSFTNNTAVRGGGGIHFNLGEGLIEDCYLEGNDSGIQGGAIYTYYAPITVDGCTFFENTSVDGAGISLDYDTGSSDTIQNCVFIANAASNEGGGLHSYERDFKAKSCLFAYNTAQWGAGIRTHSGDHADYKVYLYNCTVFSNQATAGWGGGMINSDVPMIYIYNSVFWDNTDTAGSPDIFNTGTSGMITRYCDIEQGAGTHASTNESNTGRFSSDPKFIDVDGDDNIAGTVDDIK